MYLEKITKVSVDLVSLPIRTNLADSTRKVESIGFTIVRILTDQGREGIGVTYHEVGGEATKCMIDHDIAPRLIGKSPFMTEEIYCDLTQYLRGVGRKGLTFCAISAVDIALWDLKGKILDLPINVLLGSNSAEAVPVYGSGGWSSYDDDQLVDEMRTLVARGYRMIKFKVGVEGGANPNRDLLRVRKVRDAVGPNIGIMLDANNCWDAATGIRFANRVKEMDIMFLEEPVPADDICGLRRFRQATDLPLATGEHEYTRFGALALLLAQAVDILQIDTVRTGGFTEMLKISALAQAWNIRFAPHAMEYINVHLIAALSNTLFLEQLVLFEPLWNAVFKNLPKVENGMMHVPQAPGLGLMLDEDNIREMRDRA